MSKSQAQWVQSLEIHSGFVTSLAENGVHLYAGAFIYNNFSSTSFGMIYHSTDNGTNWTKSDSYLPSGVMCLLASDSNLFAGTINKGVFLSTNNGTSWNAVNSGLSYTNIRTLAISGKNLFAGTYGGGIFLSTDNGTSWAKVNSGLADLKVKSLTVSRTKIFAGTNSNGVFLSSNNGTSWIAANTGLSGGITGLSVIGTDLFAGTNHGVYMLANDSAGWHVISAGLPVISLVVSGSDLFAGTSLGVFLYKNNGTTWTESEFGEFQQPVQTLIVSGEDIYVSAYSNYNNTIGIVWRRPLNNVSVVIKSKSELPSAFSLSQNYPNPFNPATTISFNIPSRLFVSLKVFDVEGREVTTIVSEELSAGTYMSQWNASNVSSGIYFYRMMAGSFTEAKKLILIK